MPLLSSSLSLLPLPPAFRPFSSFRFADDLRVFHFLGFSLFSSGLYPFPRSQNGSPPVTGRSTFPYGGQIFGSGRRPSSGPRHLTKTVRSRVFFALGRIRLSTLASLMPSFASVLATSDSDVALNARKAGPRSTFSTAPGHDPRRGAPCHGAGTDKFGQARRPGVVGRLEVDQHGGWPRRERTGTPGSRPLRTFPARACPRCGAPRPFYAHRLRSGRPFPFSRSVI